MWSKIKKIFAGLTASGTAKAGDISSASTKTAALSTAYFGLTIQEYAFLISIILGIASFCLSWYFKRKTFQLLKSEKVQSKIVEELNK